LIEWNEEEWAQLPIPNGPLTVGLDGGFVRSRNKRGCFEVIVGKSILEFRREEEEGAEKSQKRFGFVQTFDEKPRRRLFELLKSQGLAMNQKVVFLSDGGDDVRKVQQYLSPEAEYLLDWFHITMRITVMKQMARGLAKEGQGPIEKDREPAVARKGESMEEKLQSLKWKLWHGNVERALERVEELRWDLDLTPGKSESREKLSKQLGEFDGYIKNNREFIPNYGERYRHGGADFDGVCGINGKPSGEQAHGEEAADGLDGTRSALVVTGEDTGVEWRPGRDVPSLVPAVPVRSRAAAAATEGSRLTPRFLVVSPRTA
jgi:hypothetical protein